MNRSKSAPDGSKHFFFASEGGEIVFFPQIFVASYYFLPIFRAFSRFCFSIFHGFYAIFVYFSESIRAVFSFGTSISDYLASRQITIISATFYCYAP